MEMIFIPPALGCDKLVERIYKAHAGGDSVGVHMASQLFDGFHYPFDLQRLDLISRIVVPALEIPHGYDGKIQRFHRPEDEQADFRAEPFGHGVGGQGRRKRDFFSTASLSTLDRTQSKASKTPQPTL